MFDLRLNIIRLSIVLFAASAQAATISVYAACDVTLVRGSDGFAMCSKDGITAIARASAFSVSASVDKYSFSAQGSAYASYDAFLGLTITGGTGSGFYVPCLSLSGTGSSSSTSGRFGPDVGSPSSFCSSVQEIPFVFGVEQINELFLSAGAGPASGNAQASLGRFSVFDVNHQPISGATVSLQERTPEPSTVAVVSCGGLFLGILYRARRRRIAPPQEPR